MKKKTKKELQPIIDALKQVGRIVIMSILPVLIVSLQQSAIDWQATGIALIVAALMGIDKWVHETSKTQLTGIIPF